MKRVLVFLLPLSLLAAVLWLVDLTVEPPLSPLAATDLSAPTIPPYTPIMYGFLPYWNLSKLNPASLNHLTDIAYFAIDVNADGSLKTHTSPTQQEPGYFSLTNKFLPTRDSLLPSTMRQHLVFKLHDRDDLRAFLQDEAAQDNLIKNLDQLLKESTFHGLNIDIETDDPAQHELAPLFTSFIIKLSNLKNSHPNLILSMDIYPNAASRLRLWDLPALSPLVDYFIVMGYDYTQASSQTSGPIAPLYPSPLSRHALLKNMAELNKMVDRQKLVLGLPLYGYQWQTESRDLYAATIKRSGQMITLKNLYQNVIDHQLTIFF